MPSLVYSLSPKAAKIVEQYDGQEVVLKMQAYSSKYERTDNVFDVYWSSNLKAEA